MVQTPHSERLFRQEVARSLMRARKRKGWSYREVERRTGLQRQVVCAYLTGKRKITVRALFILSDALGCRVEIDLITE